MKAWQIGAVVAVGLGIAVGGATAPPPAEAPDGPAWLSDYEAAQATARATGKPLFVAFR